MAFGGQSQVKMSEETFDFICNTCAGDNKRVGAVKYCVECLGYVCQFCTDMHKRFPALKQHNLMEISQAPQQQGTPQQQLLEIPTERCGLHKGKLLDMYCQDHDAVGCSTCFVSDHKFCKSGSIHSIPDTIDAIFKLSECKQIYSLLKDAIVSMETLGKSKDTLLQQLVKSKNDALEDVTSFEKALAAVLKKIAESSRKEIVAVYKQIETEILQDKQTAANNLQTTIDKLDNSKGNRAQRFVCTKGAENQIKEANSEKMKQEHPRQTDVRLTFTPDQQLMTYMNSLHGIGQIKNHRKQDIYTVKTNNDINIQLSGDDNQCYYSLCYMTTDNQLIVTDRENKKLKLVDVHSLTVVDHCILDAQPYQVCNISKGEVAVSCQVANKIQFVSIQNNLTTTRQLTMAHVCFGIAYNDSKLYVTDRSESLYVYDVTGTRLKTISLSNDGQKVLNDSRLVSFDVKRDIMYVGDAKKGIVCFDRMGNYVSTITVSDLKWTMGACVDRRGNVFVVGFNSHNVVQFEETGKKVGVVLKAEDGLNEPLSMCFHPELNRMYVTMQSSNVMKMYELE